MKYSKNTILKCEKIHEAVRSYFYSDVKCIMDNVAYIPHEKFKDIRDCYKELYNEDLMYNLRFELCCRDYSFIEKSIIPDSKSPLLMVIIGILAYAGMMYLILCR